MPFKIPNEFVPRKRTGREGATSLLVASEIRPFRACKFLFTNRNSQLYFPFFCIFHLKTSCYIYLRYLVIHYINRLIIKKE